MAKWVDQELGIEVSASSGTPIAVAGGGVAFDGATTLFNSDLGRRLSNADSGTVAICCKITTPYGNTLFNLNCQPSNTRFQGNVPWSDSWAYFDFGGVGVGERVSTEFLAEWDNKRHGFIFTRISPEWQAIFLDGDNSLVFEASKTGVLPDENSQCFLGNNFTGEIYEIVVWQGGMGAADRATVGAYFDAKWQNTHVTPTAMNIGVGESSVSMSYRTTGPESPLEDDVKWVLAGGPSNCTVNPSLEQIWVGDPAADTTIAFAPALGAFVNGRVYANLIHDFSSSWIAYSFPICLRMNDANNFIGARIWSGYLQVYERVDGAFKLLHQETPPSSGLIGLQVVGSEVSLDRDGSGLQVVGTTAKMTSGYPGIVNRVSSPTNTTRVGYITTYEAVRYAEQPVQEVWAPDGVGGHVKVWPSVVPYQIGTVETLKASSGVNPVPFKVPDDTPVGALLVAIVGIRQQTNLLNHPPAGWIMHSSPFTSNRYGSHFLFSKIAEASDIGSTVYVDLNGTTIYWSSCRWYLGASTFAAMSNNEGLIGSEHFLRPMTATEAVAWMVTLSKDASSTLLTAWPEPGYDVERLEGSSGGTNGVSVAQAHKPIASASEAPSSFMASASDAYMTNLCAFLPDELSGPVVVGIDQSGENATTAADFTIPLPTGYRAGDLVIYTIFTDDKLATFPAGWNVVNGAGSNNTGDFVWKFLDESDTSPLSVNIPNSTPKVYVCHHIRGAKEVSFGPVSFSYTSAPQPSSHTFAGATLWLSLMATDYYITVYGPANYSCFSTVGIRAVAGGFRYLAADTERASAWDTGSSRSATAVMVGFK